MVAFTPTRVVHATASLGQDDLRVWTFSRATLWSLQLQGGSSMFSVDLFVDWPGAWGGRRVDADQEPITLPGSNRLGTQQRASFEALVSRLLEDLDRAPG